jgi:hypothetical protein
MKYEIVSVKIIKRIKNHEAQCDLIPIEEMLLC